MKKISLRNKNNKPSKKQELTPEKLERRAKRAFKNKIIKIFTEAGFKHIPTNDKEMHIGHRTVEVDSLFIYENIWLFCEDTIKSTNIRDHIRTKNEAFGQIKSCFNDFLSEILKLFPDLSEWNCQEMCSRRIPKILDRQESGGVMS